MRRSSERAFDMFTGLLIPANMINQKQSDFGTRIDSISSGAALEPEAKHKFVGTIHKESLRLTSLLDEILDLSALERGERTWDNRPLNAEESLDQALRVCDALARQSNTKMRVGSRAE